MIQIKSKKPRDIPIDELSRPKWRFKALTIHGNKINMTTSSLNNVLDIIPLFTTSKQAKGVITKGLNTSTIPLEDIHSEIISLDSPKKIPFDCTVRSAHQYSRSQLEDAIYKHFNLTKPTWNSRSRYKPEDHYDCETEYA